MMEFVANNNISAFTKLFPFFAIKSLHSHMSFDIVELFDISICERILYQNTLNISRNMQTTKKFAQKVLAVV